MKVKELGEIRNTSACKLLVGAVLMLVCIQQALLGQLVDWEVDSTFSPVFRREVGSAVEISAIAVQPNGKIVVGGTFGFVNDVPRNNVARLNPDGTLDLDFNPSPDRLVSCIGIQSDGKVVLGGRFTTLLANNGAPVENPYLARVNEDGTIDATFSARPNSNVMSLAIDGVDERIIVGGAFRQFLNVEALGVRGIARLHTSGHVDLSFQPYLDASFVRVVKLQRNRRILVGWDGFGKKVSKLNLDGAVDEDFNVSPQSLILAIAEGTNDRLIIGGAFRWLNSEAQGMIELPYLARVDQNGIVDTEYDAHIDGEVYDLTLRNDGKTVVTGAFGTHDENGIPFLGKRGFAVLNEDGSVCGVTKERLWSKPNVHAVLANGSVLLGHDLLTLVHSEKMDPILNIERDEGRIVWRFGNSSPHVSSAKFEYSPDEGETFSNLGFGEFAGNEWFLEGIEIPSEGVIRARGRLNGGKSSSLIETSIEVGSLTYESWISAFVVDNPNFDSNYWADPDRDGWDNAFEYLSGTDASSFRSRPIMEVDLEGGAVELRLAIAAHADLESFYLSETIDMVDWSREEFPESRIEFDENETRLLIIRRNRSSEPKYFRLGVENVN